MSGRSGLCQGGLDEAKKEIIISLENLLIFPFFQAIDASRSEKCAAAAAAHVSNQRQLGSVLFACQKLIGVPSTGS